MTTYEELLVTIEQDPLQLQHVNDYKLLNQRDKYYHLCSKAISRDIRALQYVKHYTLSKEQYYNLCIQALEKDAEALQYVEYYTFTVEQYYNLCMQALEKDAEALQYVEYYTFTVEQYYGLCVKALDKDIRALEHIKCFSLPSSHCRLLAEKAIIKEPKTFDLLKAFNLGGSHVILYDALIRHHPSSLNLDELLNHFTIIHAEIPDTLTHVSPEILTRIFDKAKQLKRWDIVKIICNMTSTNKPPHASLEQLLSEVSESLTWSELASLSKLLYVGDYTPSEGPLRKTIFTIQLENLTKALLQGKPFEVKKMDEQDILVIDGISYNFTEIIKFANMEHVELQEDDFKLYAGWVEGDECPKEACPTLNKSLEEEYRTQIYRSHERCSPSISFQEMQALNVYSNPTFYRPINQLLRGIFNFTTADKNNIKATIITAVICASAIQKTPRTTIQRSFRAETIDEKTIKERVAAVERKGVIAISGFASSTTLPLVLYRYGEYRYCPVETAFERLKGIDISAISQHPSEYEFLIPPCEVQFTSHEYKCMSMIEGYKHYFTASIVSDARSQKQQNADQAEITFYKNKKKALQGSVESILPNRLIHLKFREALYDLETKIAALKQSNPREAAAAQKLHAELATYGEEHFTFKKMNGEVFKTKCKTAVEKVRPVLNNSVWENFLNLIIMLLNFVGSRLPKVTQAKENQKEALDRFKLFFDEDREKPLDSPSNPSTHKPNR